MKAIQLTNVVPALAAIAERYSLRLLLLFGSRAEGETTEQSDVDIGVLAHSGVIIDTNYDLGLQEALFKALGTDRIDVVYLDKASPLLRYRAVSQAVVLFDRDHMFPRFASYAARYYADTRKFRGLERQFIESFLRHDN